MMSKNDYIEQKGLMCPFCATKTLKLQKRRIVVSNGLFKVPVTCTKCLSEWVDVYALSGFTTVLGDIFK